MARRRPWPSRSRPSTPSADHWRPRTGLSFLVSMGILVAPILVAILATIVVGQLVPMPHEGIGKLAWWVLVIAVPGLVYALANRLARRALPLAALLRMTMVFPDHAPTRMAVARRAGSTRALERQLAERRQQGAEFDEPAVAAEHILALAASLNRHDRLTRGHSERVRVLTDMIADELKLPQADKDRLRWSALLHDIGKLTVPTSILNKPGKPDAAEWRLLQGHPLEGARLAAPLADWLGPWADTIVQHHERYDGRGYPFGLAGEDISLGGRIVAVADSFETMTAVRSYKSLLSTEAARQELVDCAGTQFDPVVVRSFLAASVGRNHLVAGPLAWLGELPLVNGFPRLGQLAAAMGRGALAAVATVGIGIAALSGAHHASATQPPAVVPTVPAPKPPSPPAPVTRPTTSPSSTTTTTATMTGGSDAPPPEGSPGPRPTAPAGTPPVHTSPAPPLPIVGPPPAPTGVRGVSGNSRVTLSWAAPPSDGGAPITGYVVVPSVGLVAQSPRVFTSTASTETVGGLTNGTAYAFTVVAVNSAGNSPPSVPSGVIVPSTVPTAPTDVTALSGDGQATVSWTAPSSDGGESVTRYLITPHLGGVAQTPRSFRSTDTTETVHGLNDGSAYTFTVTAENGDGDSPASALSGPIVPAGVPSAPTGIVGAPGNDQVFLTWSAPADDGGAPVLDYLITPFIGSVPQSPTLFASAATTEIVDGLTNGTPYTFTVVAINSAGDSPASALSSAFTPATTPTAPSGVTGLSENGEVALSWTAPSDDGGAAITGYLVTPSIGGVAQTPISFSSTATTETVTGLTNGTEYTFTVVAINGAGDSPASAASAPITPATVPTAPSGVTGQSDDSAVTLSWTAPADEGGAPITGYQVIPSIGGVAQSPTSFSSTATTETVTGLTNGTEYTFTVIAINGAGDSPASVTSAPITPATVPTAPSGVTGQSDDSAVTLSWTAPADDGGAPITGYQVIPSIGGVAQSPTSFSSTATTETVTGLTNGTDYTFTVVAINGAGDSPASVASAPITPATVPSGPSGVTGTAGDGQVSLSWTAPADDGGAPITGYIVVPYLGPASEPPTTFNSTATTGTIGGLTNGSTYTFTVTAINSAGASPASMASVGITPATVPTAPSGVTGLSENGEVALSWSAPSDDGGAAITGYLVTPSIGGVAQTPISFSSTATTETVTGLTNGSAYTFTVVAINSAGDSPASSPSAPITPATVPTAPSGVTGTAGDGQVSLSWTAPVSDGGAAVTGYIVTSFFNGVAQNATDFSSAATTETIGFLLDDHAYTFTVVALNSAGSSPASAPSAALTPEAPSSLTDMDGNGVAGQIETGDKIVVIFNTPPSPSAFCSSWSASSYPTLSGSAVTVVGQPTVGDNVIASVNDSADCVGGFHFGSIDLGQTGYFSTVVDFSGSTISWNGINTLTITLGTPDYGGPTTVSAPSVAVYTPDPALGISGTISSADVTQF